VSDAGGDGPPVLAMVSTAFAEGSGAGLERLLADDVHWRGPGQNAECTGRAAVAAFYARITARATVVLDDIAFVEDDVATRSADPQVQVTVTLIPHDPHGRAQRHRLTLTVSQGLVRAIVQVVAPARVEVLHIDDCPGHEDLLRRLRRLLTAHGIDAELVTTRVVTDDEARRLRFLGSPTVRVNGRDVDPTVGDRAAFGMQCRLYRTPDGVFGAPPDAMILDALDALDGTPVAAAVEAIHAGDVAALRRLLLANPGLARARHAHVDGRTLLHVATDWPGHFPNVAHTVTALIAEGADPDAPGPGPHPETPLHWTASSDDVEAIDALLDGGADINAPGAVIGGGTPMADATAFGQWAAARRLLHRGARATLGEAAALGLLPQVHAALDSGDVTAEQITHAFWGACHGGQAGTAALLLAAGADINWVGWDDLTALDAAHRSDASQALLTWLRQHGAVTAPEMLLATAPPDDLPSGRTEGQKDGRTGGQVV
jgi:SnoaL-like domain/Ankyrin repeat